MASISPSTSSSNNSDFDDEVNVIKPRPAGLQIMSAQEAVSKLSSGHFADTHTSPSIHNSSHSASSRRQMQPKRTQQLKQRLEKVPWKTIFLALMLFAGGSIGYIISFGLLNCTIGSCGDPWETAYPLLIISTIMFLPGSYATFLAYQSYKKAPGYRYSQIPSFE